jgi:Zn-dependent metalloprotease
LLTQKINPKPFMKKIKYLFLLALIAIFANTYAQNPAKLSDFAKQKSSKGWIQFLPNKNIAPQQVFTSYKEAFGLVAGDEMHLIRTESDKLGYTHYRYQQYYRCVPVEGGDYIIHSIGSKSVTGNGKIITGMNKDNTPAFSAQDAISKAIKFTNAKKYMWEDPTNESFIKMAKKDISASYYPKAKLVYIDKKYGDNAAAYVLAYKVDVYAASPLSYKNIYVDAKTGEIYYTADLIRNGDVQGTAHTKYSGTQTITTDSTAPGSYRLKESARCGIHTYNLATTTNYGTATDFTDTDNDWNNVNATHDEVATDAHFGAEKTYDFYLTEFGRQSYDNLNSPLYSYVHYDVNYDNASWDGSKMTYGDGDGTNDGPLTSLDVCGHEITHGVTQYSANLIYQDEPGGLNESFSDMMGTAIEFYAVPGNSDWYMGNEFSLNGGHGFRNMANPNEFQQPDTYKGTYWYTGVMDNGGVHTNSGVSNFWFYLLCEGGSGTNDIGHVYSVGAIGMEKALQITYRTLTVYLTSTSNFMDTRVASIQAAVDLYGPCSNEVIAVANAWYAVGVGQAIADNDVYISQVLTPVTACGMTLEPVKVRMIYNGCNTPIYAGQTIHFYYKADAGSVVSDSLTLAANLGGGDTIDFTFATPADVHTLGNHTIKCWVKYAGDTIISNDTLSNYTFVNKLYQNSDVGVAKIIAPISECHMSNAENITVQLKFYGCEFLPAGVKIPVSYIVNAGTPVYDTIVNPHDFYPDSLLTHTFATPANLSAVGIYTISAATHLSIDSLNTNDALNGYTVKNPFAMKDTTATFDETNALNNFIITTGQYGHARVAASIGNNSTKGMKMTGGNVFSYINQLEFPDGMNNWIINEFLSAKVTFCVDASSWSSAFMRFDLKQTFGQSAYTTYLGAGDYTGASNCRVLINGDQQISPTYNPTTAGSDPYTSHFFDLSTYAGTKFIVTFETRNISSDTIIFVMDNSYLDNVKFMQYSDAGIETVNMNDYVKLYPNPASDLLNINFFSTSKQTIGIEVMDLQGKVIENYNKTAIAGENQYQFDMNNKSSGIYFIRINTNLGVYNGKIMKQ